MDSLLSEALALPQISPAPVALRPPTGLACLGSSAAPPFRSRIRRKPLGLCKANVAVMIPAAKKGALLSNTVQSKNDAYMVGDFMTKKKDLIVLKPSTSVDEALEKLVEYRITGFPVINDDWTLAGVVSDYDLLALDSISGSRRVDTNIFPKVNSTWKTFNEIQKLLNKTNGKIVGEVMSPAPLVIRETANLEEAARLLLETKYRRLPVVDHAGKLVGIITRGNVVGAALHIKQANEKVAQQ
ncbi:CBS domain-containing protein CBSX1, chloroplastic [Apostasia shenzhenica]|uniref:CBS domain-containing protein CBSX1, chloroplastic n=1 Tax=Apostasia shenzhenica TaxID=1088818 RepID=A0A2I0A504_9ASPA|nr:CBS domain-containing protein CBSX1, chloroplastic [Apostasia shenzhenica]